MSARTRRRTALCVPGSASTMVDKAYATTADEVVVDLEDAVAIDAKVQARGVVSELTRRPSGTVAVRVNAPGTTWHQADVEACVRNTNVSSIVVPKVESAAQIHHIAELLEALESAGARSESLTIQALIESPRALQNVATIADSHPRLVSLIIGYADLSASLGRALESSWQFARDAVLLAARSAGIQAIDGPHLTVMDDEDLSRSAHTASSQGFDGKWVIHPRQIDRVCASFTPSDVEIRDAKELVRVMRQAQQDGTGAVAWHGRMLDEALVLAAHRTLERAGLA